MPEVNVDDVVADVTCRQEQLNRTAYTKCNSTRRAARPENSLDTGSYDCAPPTSRPCPPWRVFRLATNTEGIQAQPCQTLLLTPKSDPKRGPAGGAKAPKARALSSRSLEAHAINALARSERGDRPAQRGRAAQAVSRMSNPTRLVTALRPPKAVPVILFFIDGGLSLSSAASVVQRLMMSYLPLRL
jgi:hypothetical protein